MQKATGWKVPALFTAVILGLTFIGYMFIPRSAAPVFQSELEQLAQATQIDLEADANKEWKKALVEAASGFSPLEAKDQKLKLVIREAIERKKFDVACAGVVLLKTEAIRQEAAALLLDGALSSCATVHFGICAVREEGAGADRIRKRFEECKKGDVAIPLKQ